MKPGSRDDLTVKHIKPVVSGGGNGTTNLEIFCVR